ncbi:hypothetical protein HBI56_089370 [Parastagonospora nodorum]|nr:hypothetical protein HBH52_100440 [Parastagonospora nodorum]KAH4627840.1 hypothetical protein HBH55_115820 [Parastagonospora nodorum]KAH5697080.1 hypothetical protein HBI44_103630 [Parastagonospora nodorum]KAH6519351.1 hypothetical protein HBI56_089370 [Parastagonospora nodorum]
MRVATMLQIRLTWYAFPRQSLSNSHERSSDSEQRRIVNCSPSSICLPSVALGRASHVNFFDQKSLCSPHSDVRNEEIIGGNPDRFTLVFAQLEVQLVSAGSLLEAETVVVRIFNRLSRHDPDISQRPGFAVDHGFQSDVVAGSLYDCEDNGFLLVPKLVARD